MRITPGTAVLWRDPTTVQIGSDPSKCVVFTQVTSAQREWLVQAASRSPQHQIKSAVPRRPPLSACCRTCFLLSPACARLISLTRVRHPPCVKGSALTDWMP